jgi:hypothetical protein
MALADSLGRCALRVEALAKRSVHIYRARGGRLTCCGLRLHPCSVAACVTVG